MKYQINSKTVKLIGRTLDAENILWCGLSGSGIAFQADAKMIKVTIAGDDTTQGNITEGKARIGIWVNGTRTMDRMVNQPFEEITIVDEKEVCHYEIQIIKLSECAMSVMGISAIETEDGAKIYPAVQKERKIEFIGDSITCGYGVDMEDAMIPFRTDTEDATKAYAYKTAQKLNAEYSMVSYSGYGIISGYTATAEAPTKELVPPYYEKVGFSYGHPNKNIHMEEQEWDFSRYIPQVVVINLGTNDDSYCQDNKDRQAAFIEKYVDFLQMVRKDNPDAKIVCVVGMMGTRIYSSVEAAVKKYKTLSLDENVSSMMLFEQVEEDGLVSDFHPTERTHEKASNQLVTKLKQVMNW